MMNKFRQTLALLALAFSLGLNSTAQTVSTFVSDLSQVGDGMDVDSSGNIFVASGNRDSIVWKITPEGTASEFAAGFSYAVGVAIDNNDNVFANNYNSGVLSKMTPEGEKSDFATDLDGPAGLAFDSQGYLYVTEFGANFSGTGAQITRISPEGEKSVFASGAPLEDVIGIAIDELDNVYFTNWSDKRVYKIPSGTKTPELLATLDGVTAINQITYSKGYIYVPAPIQNIVYKVDTDGTFEVLAGSGSVGADDGQALEATFNDPNSIAANQNGDKLYVLDQKNKSIRAIDTSNTEPSSASHSFRGLYHGTTSDGEEFVFFSDRKKNNYARSYNYRTGEIAIATSFPISSTNANRGQYDATSSSTGVSIEGEINGSIVSGTIEDLLFTGAKTDSYDTTDTTLAAAVGNYWGSKTNIDGDTSIIEILIYPNGKAYYTDFGPNFPEDADGGVGDVSLTKSSSGIIGTVASLPTVSGKAGSLNFFFNTRDSVITGNFEGANPDDSFEFFLVREPSAARMSNLSTRGYVTSSAPAGGGNLVAGLVIGPKAKTVLIRAVGQKLSDFGIQSPLSDPILELVDAAGNRVAINDNWNNNIEVTKASVHVGAFELPEGSTDSAILISLEAGAYTAKVTSSDGTDGVALVEAYEVY